jgi:bacterioferritin
MSRTKSPDVIRVLNDVLTGELTAINQYFLHAKMFQNWGYERLYTKVYRESIDEMKHADSLIERVLYLDGLPNVQRLAKVNIGEDVEECLTLDLALEYDALTRLHDGIDVCIAERDNGSRLLLESILASEEEHVDWLEAQRDLIAQVGLQGYLAEQIRPE